MGVTRALLFPVPVRAPRLARVGVVACEKVFLSSFVPCRPVALYVPFLASGLTHSVWIVSFACLGRWYFAGVASLSHGRSTGLSLSSPSSIH